MRRPLSAAPAELQQQHRDHQGSRQRLPLPPDEAKFRDRKREYKLRSHVLISGGQKYRHMFTAAVDRLIVLSCSQSEGEISNINHPADGSVEHVCCYGKSNIEAPPMHLKVLKRFG